MACGGSRRSSNLSHYLSGEEIEMTSIYVLVVSLIMTLLLPPAANAGELPPGVEALSRQCAALDTAAGPLARRMMARRVTGAGNL
jgi:hypothetical protein